MPWKIRVLDAWFLAASKARPVGFEPTTFGFEVRGHEAANPIGHKDLGNSDYDVAALGQRAASTDPDLAAVIDAWGQLPEALRTGIVAMVKAATKG
jgi:hypothetical protein